ncbi:MAG: peptide chain release factor N(5)-glutamine methyltransferase [Muribaculaceae bacterium]|nr:peptide chain release factor N(5)-glutamine methyltransferase [Muribaculaceae bacterium]
MTLLEKNREIKQKLTPIVGEREAYWMARDIIDDILGYSEVELLIKGNEELSDFVIGKIDSVVERVEKGEPLQYVLGWARFEGNRFKVTRDTLIPRPETQELVDLIISRHGEEKDLRVMDVGTGSGCIAITLARGLKFPLVSAIDISQGALDVASVNAKALKTKVNFQLRDALSLHKERGEQYDIIVSNPPYIAEHEQIDMERSVLDYEPSTALFVPNDDPLRFYRVIATFGVEALNRGGYIYYEINPLFATEMVEMMRQLGYHDIEIVNDMQGKERILCAKR